MKKNNIFNLDRFLGLIGTGIYRRKNSKTISFAIYVGLMFLFVILQQLISNLEFDNARTVLTRVYQMSYIIFLSIPTCRMAFNEQMTIQWNLLPASAFEKNLFSVLVMMIWRSILFFIVIYGADYLIWISSPFVEKGMEISHCRLRLADFFSFGVTSIALPRWVLYILVFFFYTSLPIITGINNNSSIHRGNPFSYVYLVYIVISTFYDYSFSNNRREYLVFVLGCFGIIGFFYDIIFSFIRSYNTKA